MDGDPRGCDHSAGDAVRLDPPLDEAEDAALTVMRLFFVAHAEREQAAWQVAFTAAASAFGPRRGAYIGYLLMKSIEVMSRSRRSAFSFMNPRCPTCRRKFTVCEQRMMRVMRALHADDGAEAQTQALLLCEGNLGEGYLHAARAAAEALYEGATELDAAQRAVVLQ